MMRRLLVIVVLSLIAGVPAALAAMADPFGAPEVSDPILRPIDGVTPVLGADAAGNAYWLSFVGDSNGGRQAAVYQRCSGSPWQPALLGSRVTTDLWPVGLRVAADGTAMAIWR